MWCRCKSLAQLNNWPDLSILEMRRLFLIAHNPKNENYFS